MSSGRSPCPRTTIKDGDSCPISSPYETDSLYKKNTKCCRKTKPREPKKDDDEYKPCPLMKQVTPSFACESPLYAVKSPLVDNPSLCCRKTEPKNANVLVPDKKLRDYIQRMAKKNEKLSEKISKNMEKIEKKKRKAELEKEKIEQRKAAFKKRFKEDVEKQKKMKEKRQQKKKLIEEELPEEPPVQIPTSLPIQEHEDYLIPAVDWASKPTNIEGDNENDITIPMQTPDDAFGNVQGIFEKENAEYLEKFVDFSALSAMVPKYKAKKLQKLLKKSPTKFFNIVYANEEATDYINDILSEPAYTAQDTNENLAIEMMQTSPQLVENIVEDLDLEKMDNLFSTELEKWQKTQNATPVLELEDLVEQNPSKFVEFLDDNRDAAKYVLDEVQWDKNMESLQSNGNKDDAPLLENVETQDIIEAVTNYTKQIESLETEDVDWGEMLDLIQKLKQTTKDNVSEEDASTPLDSEPIIEATEVVMNEVTPGGDDFSPNEDFDWGEMNELLEEYERFKTLFHGNQLEDIVSGETAEPETTNIVTSSLTPPSPPQHPVVEMQEVREEQVPILIPKPKDVQYSSQKVDEFEAALIKHTCERLSKLPIVNVHVKELETLASANPKQLILAAIEFLSVHFNKNVQKAAHSLINEIYNGTDKVIFAKKKATRRIPIITANILLYSREAIVDALNALQLVTVPDVLNWYLSNTASMDSRAVIQMFYLATMLEKIAFSRARSRERMNPADMQRAIAETKEFVQNMNGIHCILAMTF